jgi:hypothetical protein
MKFRWHLLLAGFGLITGIASAYAFPPSGCVTLCGGSSSTSNDNASPQRWSEPEEAPTQSRESRMSPREREGLLFAQQGYKAWMNGNEELALQFYQQGFDLFPTNRSIRQGYCAVHNNRAINMANVQGNLRLALRYALQAQSNCPQNQNFATTVLDVRDAIEKSVVQDRVRFLDKNIKERVGIYVQELEAYLGHASSPPRAFEFVGPGSSELLPAKTRSVAVRFAPSRTVEMGAQETDKPNHNKAGLSQRSMSSASPKADIILDSLEVGNGDWSASIRYLEMMLAKYQGDSNVAEALNYVRGISARQRATANKPLANDAGKSGHQTLGVVEISAANNREDVDEVLDEKFADLLAGDDEPSANFSKASEKQALLQMIDREIDSLLTKFIEEEDVRSRASQGLNVLEENLGEAERIFRELTNDYPEETNFRDVASYLKGLVAAQNRSR